MATIKDKGICIKTQDVSESDRRLTLLLLDRGRVTCYARGAKKTGSKFHAAAQVFAYSEFVLFEGPNFYSLAQCELKQNFYGVRADYDRLCLAAHIMELAEQMLMPDVPCQNALRVIYFALQKLAVPASDALRTAAVFELKFLQGEGFIDNELPKIPANFSVQAKNAVAEILNADIRQAFELSREVGAAQTSLHETREIMNALDLFRREILGFPLKSIQLLNVGEIGIGSGIGNDTYA
ncbi:MAG: DNA repair protein RecO [Defluviitaleaceae bacterium]|nr:DNA repair protein RecO [Defluviitaleaceae bacterium]